MNSCVNDASATFILSVKWCEYEGNIAGYFHANSFLTINLVAGPWSLSLPKSMYSVLERYSCITQLNLIHLIG